MTTLNTLAIVAALFAGGTSLAMAQNGPATGGEPPVAGGAAGNPAWGSEIQLRYPAQDRHTLHSRDMLEPLHHVCIECTTEARTCTCHRSATHSNSLIRCDLPPQSRAARHVSSLAARPI